MTSPRSLHLSFTFSDRHSLEPLMLRRPDSRRSTTQTWYFSGGKLTCGLSRLVVQVGPLNSSSSFSFFWKYFSPFCGILDVHTTCPMTNVVTCAGQVKGGTAGLRDGAEVLLGPDSVLLDLSPEQQFSSQKMRPGSGVLSVQVLPDGPTRVLQVQKNIN